MGGGTSPPSHSPSHNPSQQNPSPPLPLRVLSHNIRYATPTPFPGEAPWPTRKPLLCAQLLHTLRAAPSTTVLFLQEVLFAQYQDICRSLITHASSALWAGTGRARDDGERAGEYSPILYDAASWLVVAGSAETVWLNETGEVGRRGWDAASVRIVTTVVLDHLQSGRRVLFMNTHLDDQGSVSRREGARIILRECEARRERFAVDAVVLGGDLNSETDGDAYPVIADFGKSGVVDVRMLATGENVYGEEHTFTGFDGGGDGEKLKRIDFLFWGTKNDDDLDWSKPGYAVLPNRFEDGVYLSDHRAVVVDLVVT